MTQAGVPIAEGLKILDFGLAKIKSGELLGSFIQAKTSGLMGSPFYMAPEQWSDEEPDARADIYSLGIILYQMLGGDVPFKGSSIPSIMKKHLTQPPPTFKSIGVDVYPQIESVVRHALEKEPSERTPSVEVFLAELRQAVAAAGSTMRSRRQTITGDPNETMLAPAPDTDASLQQTTAESAFESMAGTISSSELGVEEQERIAASRAAYEREQQEKERIAREELEREAEARRKVQEEAERKRKEEEQRLRKEREEREERERQQREQMERVERQAKELEERLARLATSIPPQITIADSSQATVADLEATQVQQAVRTEAVSNNSFPGVASIPPQSVPPQSLPPQSIPPFAVSMPPKSKSNSLLIIGAVVLVLFLLVGGGTAAYFLLWSKSSGTGGGDKPTNQGTPQITPEVVKADLVEIPGGTFQMGRNDGPPQERPEHSVTVKNFYMDRTEVTNAEYAEFVRDTGYQAPSQWVGGRPLTGQERWPVVNVSPKDAEAFAAWRSKRDGVTYRLPTEEEWEYAARSGGEYKSFPWGDSWEEKRAVVKEAAPRSVGAYPGGKNRWGVLDLIGNVWEWTSSKASLYTGTEQIPPENREWIVARGGSYASDPTDRLVPISATYRDWYTPTLRHQNYGFRLVRSGE
jgi:formylglycine-generating enzyme required for sulfatase activity